jgi:hypothetical protein
MITASHTIPLNYRGVALAAPFSTSYQRYSLETAHWWIATVLRGSLEDAGLETSDIDGFSVSSFTIFPGTAVGLTQHFGLTVRWLDHVPMGGGQCRRRAQAGRSRGTDRRCADRGMRCGGHEPHRQLPTAPLQLLSVLDGCNIPIRFRRPQCELRAAHRTPPPGRRFRFQHPWKHCGSKRERNPSCRSENRERGLGCSLSLANSATATGSVWPIALA